MNVFLEMIKVQEVDEARELVGAGPVSVCVCVCTVNLGHLALTSLAPSQTP